MLVIWVPKEKSAGAVVFRREKANDKEKIFYLVLHYHFKGDYWDFPRGKIEKGETEDQTAKREIKEETGIENSELEFVESFRETTSWFYKWKGETIAKEAVYFLAETKQEKVEVSFEHLGYKWLEFDEAMKTLTYENTKEILKAAREFLQKHNKSDIEKFLKDK